MDIYVYFRESDEYSLDEYEDEIDDILGEKGEVTGSGGGRLGCNLDIELYDDTFLLTFLEKIQEIGLPKDAYYTINGNKRGIYAEQ